MKKNYLVTKQLILLAGILLSFTAISQERLEITSGNMILNQDTIFEVTAEYHDSSDLLIEDAKIKWYTEPGYLGKVDKDNFLITNHSGEGFLIAKYKELRDSVSLNVNGEVKDDDDEDSDDNNMEDEYPKIKIIPDHIKVEISDSVELRAFYIDTAGVKIDTTFTWSVEPSDMGTFNDPAVPMFYSTDITGKGIIIATLGELADTAKITIYESKEKRAQKEKENNIKNNKGKQLTILPGDTVIYVDAEPILYTAEYKSNGNKHQNAEFIWSTSDTSIAVVDEHSGLVTLTGEPGMTLVSTEYSNFKACVELLVVDSTADMEVNTISIRRVLPNGNELKAKTLKEGESYKISGLPFPLNILNGGQLHFPFGCIDEDIDIFMFIPEEYAHTCDSCTSVTFSDDIVAGVQFSVQPVGSDTIVEPYRFNEYSPVNLSMVFKHELLDSLEVSPEDMDVFFAENTGFEEMDGHVAVDTVKNKIYANIIHFSTIVAKEKSATTSAKGIVPIEKNLTVYPNPFNSSTTIQFSLESACDVNIEIFNLLGQKVQVLANREYTKGIHKVIWQGSDQSGTPATSGIYLCRFTVDGKADQIKKIVLNR